MESKVRKVDGGNVRVAYVLKVYPRFSQTFVLNELLAHQAAGAPVDILSLRRPNDGPFHAGVSQVQPSVTYLDVIPTPNTETFRQELLKAGEEFPNLWDLLSEWMRISPLLGQQTAIRQAIAAARIVKARGIEHLHAHFANLASDVAHLAAKLANISFSFTAHARDIFHDSVDRAKLGHHLQAASGVVTVSKFNQEYLSREFGRGAERVRVVYNGLDLQKFAFHSPNGPRPAKIVAVGRLIPKKGFEDLVSAMQLVRDQGTHVVCEIIGEGPLEESLRQQVESLGLSAVVKLVGPLPTEKVIESLVSSRMLAAPCVVGDDGDRDGLPTVLLEAMALGTPCISTDVTGIPEVVRSLDTGLIVPQHDPPRLAAACLQLLNDAPFAHQLAWRARSLIEADFDVHSSSRQLRHLFSSSARTHEYASNSCSPRPSRESFPSFDELLLSISTDDPTES